MTISQSALVQHCQPNVILAQGYEFLSDVIQRFLNTELPDKDVFLVAQIGDGTYRAARFDRISSHLNRQGQGDLFRPVADIEWLAEVAKVTGLDGRMNDDDVARWARRRDGKALVIEDQHTFAGLIYQPAVVRSASPPALLDIFKNFVSRAYEVADDYAVDEAYAEDSDIAYSKGLESLPIDNPSSDSAITPPPMPAAPTSSFPRAASDGEESAGASSDSPDTETGEGATARPALTVPFHTDIRFANWLKPGDTRPLTVQLVKEIAERTMVDKQVVVGFQDEFTPETILILLDAPGFIERTDTWKKPIDVFSFQDSDKATFILTAGQDEGEQQISIDFRHKERLIGNARFVVQVSNQPVADSQTVDNPVTDGPVAEDFLTFRQPAPEIEIPSDPPGPPDVELRIRADGQRLSFELHSPHEEVDASHTPMGAVELSDPQLYMHERFKELSEWATQQPTDQNAVVEITDRLTAMGNGLFLQLFTDKLKRAYWKLRKLRDAGKLTTFHIVSDEPWIPWEMVKPVDLDEGEADGFLAQAWQVSRWLAGPGQKDRLNITEARLVAPDSDLDFVQRERDFFAGLTTHSVHVTEPLRQLAQVRQIAREGVELLHFSTHGKLNSQSVDRSAILLQDNAELRPDDLLGEVVMGLRKRRPLIFLNTCHGARMGFSLSGLGGWASHMINDVKAGVFIGALWEVNDTLAAEFALRFYTELQANSTLGAAFSTAREHIRVLSPANSTWLAYTLYGDPNMRVQWGDGKQVPQSESLE